MTLPTCKAIENMNQLQNSPTKGSQAIITTTSMRDL